MAPSVRPIALACALGIAALAAGASGSARAQDDGTIDNSTSIWNLERRIWNGFVRGLGLRSGDEPVIEYRERSPLVVPPSRELPPPQPKAAAKNPAWPNDPDAARRKQRADAKKTVGNVDLSRVYDQQGRPMSPQELNVPGGTPSAASGPPPTGGDGRPMAPSELGYFGGLFSSGAWGFGGYRNEVGTFTAEPPRATLTAPPPGYQTPSPDHPYGTTRRVERAAPKAYDPAGEYAR